MANSNPNAKREDKIFSFKKEFMDNLEENLTCSKCNEVPRIATVSWCTAHHLMCKRCYDHHALLTKKVEKCNCGRLCKTCTKAKHVQCGEGCNVESKPALSPFVANVLTVLPTKCKFTHNGCQVIKLLKELEVHEVDCVYRYIECPFLSCDEDCIHLAFIGSVFACGSQRS
jgi:hypothetical protein